jgi:hypothetical protein
VGWFRLQGPQEGRSDAASKAASGTSRRGPRSQAVCQRHCRVQTHGRDGRRDNATEGVSEQEPAIATRHFSDCPASYPSVETRGLAGKRWSPPRPEAGWPCRRGKEEKGIQRAVEKVAGDERTFYT